MNQSLYRIKSITHPETNQPRLDGRYPQRIGRTCCRPTPIIGIPLFINYVLDENGFDYSNMVLRTSTVQSVSTYGNTIKITTLNSVYEFEKVEDAE